MGNRLIEDDAELGAFLVRLGLLEALSEIVGGIAPVIGAEHLAARDRPRTIRDRAGLQLHTFGECTQ